MSEGWEWEQVVRNCENGRVEPGPLWSLAAVDLRFGRGLGIFWKRREEEKGGDFVTVRGKWSAL